MQIHQYIATRKQSFVESLLEKEGFMKKKNHVKSFYFFLHILGILQKLKVKNITLCTPQKEKKKEKTIINNLSWTGRHSSLNIT